ncbi:VWA domain-containing protein [Winogradskyella endarachnes]|uniref:DUF3520 domain-containing protein n=1 Tax=Winogradskyella endarachnes TaxID=2681965 RepID=A0A6L6U651_9FLAO|nr:VWA domain-containing protein [Winogradskyella endarachnes]MUU76976.1 DUF3520 domain-containing protein [Winogradskyella endarachnes]
MKNFILICCIILSAWQLQSQEKTITGTVTADFDGTPLPGVTVTVGGTSQGTQTNFDGKYSIKVKPEDVLKFSFLGYKTVTKKVNEAIVIDISMLVDDLTLDEVVVVGYGTYQKQAYTRAVSSVRTETKRRPNANLAQTLQGQVSGINITSGSGQPGTNANVRIRGIGTINGNNKPLIIVDGVPFNGDINSIDPNDIESITVLKDSEATAIYGSRAGNGAVQISSHTKTYKETNTETYAEIHENPFKISGLTPLSTFSIDVDKAGYSNVRRMINNGQRIVPDAVKLEEMVNYFNYSYPQPEDEHPFSIHTEVVKTPWHADTQLVRIGLQGKTYENNNLPPSNLTFLIDVSGSMSSQNKLPLLKSAFKLLVNQLREKDKVSIVVYAGAAGVVLEPTSGNQKQTILNALDNLNAGGSTAGGAGIDLAYKLAEKNFKKDGNNRVILATDGDFNVGASSDKAMKKLIEEKRNSGVFLSVLGFGYGNYKDSKLETLADKGNGNHAYIDNMQEAQKVFGKEFGGTLYTIAKDVKIQIEFNPQKVQAYRLIGYENRLLADEDFIDDTKDAGELGSGHTVTALYEVIPIGVENDYLKKAPKLKYTSSAQTENFKDELFTVKFRYKKPTEDVSIQIEHIQHSGISEASVDMNFASAVALFGMQLRQSKYFNEAPLSQVIQLAELGRGEDKEGYRAEFIRLVKAYDNLN